MRSWSGAPLLGAAILCVCVTVAGSGVGVGTAVRSQPQPRWTMSTTGVKARLRGISAASERVIWTSGNNGTILRTEDGGRSWQAVAPPDTASLDFRDIDAVSERTAYALSIGPGDASRIYRTDDGGSTWTLQFTNQDPEAFFDAMAFSNGRRGFAVSDSVRGQLVILETSDGARWARVPPGNLPGALPGEGAYAASGTNIAIHGQSIWIGTSASRVIRSADDGRTWTVSTTPLPTGSSAGIFSIAFRDARNGIVVGGDYRKEQAPTGTAALTGDAGASWTPVRGLGGFRSAVLFLTGPKNTVVAVGPSGADYSEDHGRTWRAIDGPGFHTIATAAGSDTAWAAGENGTVAQLRFDDRAATPGPR